MSLVKCPECSNDISERATVCPKCGDPRHQTKNAEQAKTLAEKEKESVVIQRALSEETDYMEHQTKKAKIWCFLDILAGIILLGGGIWLMIYTRTATIDLGFLNKVLGDDVSVKYLGELSSIGLWGLALATLMQGVLWSRQINSFHPIIENLRMIRNKI